MSSLTLHTTVHTMSLRMRRHQGKRVFVSQNDDETGDDSHRPKVKPIRTIVPNCILMIAFIIAAVFPGESPNRTSGGPSAFKERSESS